MTLSSFFLTALTAAGTLLPPLTAPTPAATGNECASACLEYLEDESAALRCQVQCATGHQAMTLELPLTEIPDGIPVYDVDPWTTDHEWCLETCDDPERSATNRETCKLNCATSWSVLTSEPSVCDEYAAGSDLDVCLDEEAMACRRGCFASSVTCRDACESAEDARETDTASCKLRCDNVGELCNQACASDEPDAYLTDPEASARPR